MAAGQTPRRRPGTPRPVDKGPRTRINKPSNRQHSHQPQPHSAKVREREIIFVTHPTKKKKR